MKDSVKKKLRDQFVLLYWIDACIHGSEQISRKEAIRDCTLIKGISGGILVDETKDSFTLALDWFHSEDEFRSLSTYPKTGIYKVVRYYFKK